MAKLHIAQDVLDQMRAACERAYPHEACGLLVGDARDGKRRVHAVHAARNLDEERPRDRYLLDPSDFVRADGIARAGGLDILGIYHSHPDQSDEPSPTDLADAQPGWSYVIVSVAGDGASGRAGSQRSWVVADGERASSFAEEHLCIC